MLDVNLFRLEVMNTVLSQVLSGGRVCDCVSKESSDENQSYLLLGSLTTAGLEELGNLVFVTMLKKIQMWFCFHRCVFYVCKKHLVFINKACTFRH